MNHCQISKLTMMSLRGVRAVVVEYWATGQLGNATDTAPMTSAMRLSRNITIIGPPGSGKGFYGRPLASFFNVSLLTASTVLRQAAPDLDLNSGQLIDCETVSQNLKSYLSTQDPSRRYLLDGYPRTPQQIQLMERHWPAHHQVQYCLHLDVPDEVCERKMLGRRHCSQCGAYCNLANVQILGFHLPPQIPTDCVQQSSKSFKKKSTCQPDKDWTRRSDDTPEIVRERLREYRQYETPILDYYRCQGRLLSFTPYLGELDIPKLQVAVEEWLRTFEQNRSR